MGTMPLVQERSFWSIFCFVLFLHAVLLFFFLFFENFQKPRLISSKTSRLVVRTFEERAGSTQVASQPLLRVEEPVQDSRKPEPVAIEPPAPPASLNRSPAPENKTESVPKKKEPVKSKTSAPKVAKKAEKPKESSKEKPKESSKTVSKPAPAKPKESKEKQKPAKKEEKSDQAKKQEEKKKQEEIEQAARKKKLLAEAQEKIAKIAQNRDNNTAPSKRGEAVLAIMPGTITTLAIEQAVSGEEAPLSKSQSSYRDELAGRLKLLLILPEVGEVKLKLTLERSGKVAKLAMISSESTKNQHYIEKTLPTLSFPPPPSGEGTLTFSITLSNDI
jgi:colicin import membrane protein